jgi:hypothetical protein
LATIEAVQSRCFLAFLALAAGACAGPAAQPTAPELEPHLPAAAPAVAATAASQDASPAPAAPRQTLELVSLQPTPPPNPPAVIEIKFPILGQLISSEKAAAFKVRLKVENWPLAARGSGVEIALDEHPPQRVLALDETPLGSLNGQLAPGEHLLVAWAVRETGEVVRPAAGTSRGPFAAVRFSIGESRSSSPPAEIKVLRYVSPTGTINGDRAADAVLVDFLPLPMELSPEAPLRVKIQGDGAGAPPWTAQLVQPAWAPVGVRGLPNGDWKITLERGTHRVTQVITVNRELAPALVP